jgi:DNA-binding transcriptional LysR family regulator
MLSDQDLALLDAIRATGSLSRAAHRLAKAPSTVSHAARQLERRYGAALFDRRGYRLRLTRAGDLLVDESARLSAEHDRLARRVRQIGSGWEDRLHIAVDSLIEFDALLPTISAFDALHCGVDLRFGNEVLNGAWEALRDGRAELVIGGANEPPAIPQLRRFELGLVEWVFAVSPRHPLARRTGVLTPELLAGERAVVVADSARRIDPRSIGIVDGQPLLAVPDMTAKIAAQRHGLGVGWLPRSRVELLLERGELVEKRASEPREPNMMYVAWRADREGRALTWWLEKLRSPRLARRLVLGNTIR